MPRWAAWVPRLGPLEILHCLALGTAAAVIFTLRRQVKELQLHTLRDATYQPEMIVLLRHGESEANVDHTKYGDKGDPNVALTAAGRQQAAVAGDEVAKLAAGRRLLAFVSPYKRTRQTADIVLTRVVKAGVEVATRREDPRLREREFSGTFQRKRPDMSDAEGYSRFFWRPPGGESCADVYDRITAFIDTLWRSFRNRPETAGSVALVVTHGLTMRVFAMRWLHWTPEMFHQTWNPGNCAMLVFARQGRPGGGIWYRLTNQSLCVLGLAGCQDTHAESSRHTWAAHTVPDPVEA